MKQIDNNFEDFFREQFEEFESAPNPDSWQIIQERLQQKRRRIALWWWLPTGIAAMLIGFLCLKSFSNKANENTVETVKIERSTNTDTIIQPDTDTNKSEENSTIREEKTTPIFENKIKKQAVKDILPQRKNTHYELTQVQNETSVYHDVPNIDNSTPNTPLQTITIENKIGENKAKINISFLPTLLNQVVSGEEIIIKAPLSIRSEDKNTLNKPQKKASKIVTFAVDIAPTYNFKNISPNTSDDSYINNILIPAIASAQRIGLQIGTDIDFKLTKHLGFSTLLGYQYTPFDVAYDLRKNETPNIDALVINKGNTLTINNVTYNTERISISQNWHALNATFALNFYSNEKNKWSAGIGTGKWFGKDKPSGNPFFTSLTYTHKFNNGLKVAPFFRYDLKNYTSNNNLLKVQPYQLGLKIQF